MESLALDRFNMKDGRKWDEQIGFTIALIKTDNGFVTFLQRALNGYGYGRTKGYIYGLLN